MLNYTDAKWLISALRAALAGEAKAVSDLKLHREETFRQEGAFARSIRTVEADAARLREALEKFGHHDSVCEQWSHFSGASIRDPHARCSCGLTAALTAPRGEEKEREP